MTDAHLVELEVRIENQLGDVTADGTSIVELPTKLELAKHE